ncbi:hypothetical protein FGO68_gene6901 [Halteria grandinella]|uniref:Uncharacterized protein n=1 Tax=Halteria grandinella TaxID=5974 RepID=A0A8J8SUT7_HALGN|nr:hypothetical protein FGO68_gene6901 [Halteria grandinella]
MAMSILTLFDKFNMKISIMMSGKTLRENLCIYFENLSHHKQKLTKQRLACHEEKLNRFLSKLFLDQIRQNLIFEKQHSSNQCQVAQNLLFKSALCIFFC